MDFVDEFKTLGEKVSKVHVALSKSLPLEFTHKELISHIRKYPSISLRDLYKFIHQGTSGWSHLSQLGDLQHIKTWLIDEMASVGDPLDRDELFELIDKDTGIGRLNLRIWKQEPRFTIEDLWNLMMESNKRVPNSSLLFLSRWHFLQECITKGYFVMQPSTGDCVEKWLNLVLEMVQGKKVNEIPLVSHSELFRLEYSPHYRLVNKLILEEFLNHFNISLNTP